MNTSNGNEPAYPHLSSTSGGNGDQIPIAVGNETYWTQISHGLTKREEFAKAAMQGLAANPLLWEAKTELMSGWSVELADALLAELAK